MTSDELDHIEAYAACPPETYEKNRLLDLVNEVRKLKHKLHDPRYFYDGVRVTKSMLVQRDQTIASMDEELEYVARERDRLIVEKKTPKDKFIQEMQGEN